MRPKRIHLRLDWTEKETIVREQFWFNKFMAENPELEGFGNYFTQHIENKALELVFHHDTEPEVIKVLKAFLIAFSKKRNEITYIEITTDVCLDDVGDGLWLSSLMPEANTVMGYLYSANLEHIYEFNNRKDETD